MEESMEMIENEDIPSEGAPGPPGDIPPDDMGDVPADPPISDQEIPAEDPAEPDPADQGDIEDRLGDLLEQIGAGQDLGSMGDYYIADAGCYAFPTEDVFFHFIAEEERPGWTVASNGCYVPAGSLEAYEAYLSSGYPGEDTEGEQSPPPVTQEDLSGLTETLQAMYEQDAAHYETVTLHMETTDQVLSEMQRQLFKTDAVIAVACFFLAFLCGVKLADVFWNRMRAG